LEAMNASTGPRSRERGNLLPRRAPDSTQEASTGPRSRERGNSPCAVRCLGSAAGFNGAALTRARKHHQHTPAKPSYSRFNGAALTRARKRAASFTGAGMVSVLQRGRAHASAETTPTPTPPPDEPKASTGPRSRERGNSWSRTGTSRRAK